MYLKVLLTPEWKSRPSNGLYSLPIGWSYTTGHLPLTCDRALSLAVLLRLKVILVSLTTAVRERHTSAELVIEGPARLLGLTGTLSPGQDAHIWEIGQQLSIHQSLYSGPPLSSPPRQRPPNDAEKCHFLHKSTPHQRPPLLCGHFSAAFGVALLQGDQRQVIYNIFFVSPKM